MLGIIRKRTQTKPPRQPMLSNVQLEQIWNIVAHSTWRKHCKAGKDKEKRHPHSSRGWKNSMIRHDYNIHSCLTKRRRRQGIIEGAEWIWEGLSSSLRILQDQLKGFACLTDVSESLTWWYITAHFLPCTDTSLELNIMQIQLVGIIMSASSVHVKQHAVTKFFHHRGKESLVLNLSTNESCLW